MGFFLIFGTIVLIPHLFLYSDNFFFAGFSKHHLVHLDESFLQSTIVLLLLVTRVFLQLLNKVALNESGYFGPCVRYNDTSVAIEYSEDGIFLVRKRRNRNVGVLHVDSPA